jgi:hypothetical protein
MLLITCGVPLRMPSAGWPAGAPYSGGFAWAKPNPGRSTRPSITQRNIRGFFPLWFAS